jgi:hypothetical protein
MTPVLRTALASLHGLECWSVIGGAGTGSTVSLGFGAQIPARRFSSNPKLTLDERRFEPEYSIYVESAWRLEDKEQVLAAWTEAASGESWLDELKRLRGLKVESTELRTVGLDLEIHFEGGLTYAIFCDQGDDDENYSVFTPQHVVTVGSRSRLLVESRS